MISKDEIKHLGWLSRLELTEKEIDKYSRQIDEIIRYFDKLDTIPLRKGELSGSIKTVAELRNDRVEVFEGDPLRDSKNRKDGFLKGPRIS
jgi:aspartyl-tRNA(Asn)/glutamyl-tRNA(Gln) amidotransferase subunit C